MKGYTEVSRNVAQQALDNYQSKLKQSKAVLEKGIELFYEERYVKGGKFKKWWYRKNTKEEFAQYHTEAFGSYADTFHKVLSEDELDLLWWRSYRPDGHARDLSGLLKSASTNKLYLGEDLCKFVNQYRSEV